MKILVWAPCIALHFWGVGGFKGLAVARASRRHSSLLWLNSGTAGPIDCKRSFPTSTVSRERVLSTATMKLEVESAQDQTDPDRYRSALVTTALAVGGAAVFGLGINQFMGAEKAVQYFAGYVVELSLSVDNLFVFLLLFKFFQVREQWESGVVMRCKGSDCEGHLGSLC